MQYARKQTAFGRIACENAIKSVKNGENAS